jgi:hypothetical protein
LYLNETNFDLAAGAQVNLSQFYNGNLNIHSVYGNALYNFSDKLSIGRR